MAATMRCSIAEISKQFGTRAECVIVNTYTPEPAAEKEEHEEVEAEVHNDIAERLETVARKQYEYEENRKMYAQQALSELKELQ
jgi:hypothetical protein